MAEVTTFSSSGEDAISRTIDLHEEVPGVLPQDQFEETYDIPRTVEEIEKGDYKRVDQHMLLQLWDTHHQFVRSHCSSLINSCHILYLYSGHLNPGQKDGNSMCLRTHHTEGWSTRKFLRLVANSVISVVAASMRSQRSMSRQTRWSTMVMLA